MQTVNWAKEGMEGQGHFWKNPCRLISMKPRPRYQVSVYRTNGPSGLLSPLQIITSISLKTKKKKHKKNNTIFNLRKKGSTNQYSVTAAQDPSKKQNNTRWEMLNACWYTGSVTIKLPVCNETSFKRKRFSHNEISEDRHLCITASLGSIPQRWELL